LANSPTSGFFASLDVNIQDLVWKFFAEELAEEFFYRGKQVLVLTISMQTWQFLLKRVWSAGAPRVFAPARNPQKPHIFGKGIFAVLLYNHQASKQGTA
jgi:hypothetical protein